MDWFQFRTTILEEFDVSTHADKMLELLTLKRVGTSLEYKTQFERVVYHIKLFDKSISETFLITKFILVLKFELRSCIEV
jgi:hypothetical protein